MIPINSHPSPFAESGRSGKNSHIIPFFSECVPKLDCEWEQLEEEHLRLVSTQEAHYPQPSSEQHKVKPFKTQSFHSLFWPFGCT